MGGEVGRDIARGVVGDGRCPERFSLLLGEMGISIPKIPLGVFDEAKIVGVGHDGRERGWWWLWLWE